MPSPAAERAVADAQRVGRAVLKFISPNDVGLTGSHQLGYYLPKPVWKTFTPFPPERGRNDDHPVEAIWPDGRSTNSKVKWYGRAKSEYRLTGFNRERNFPFISHDCVGSLLVLVPERIDRFFMHVLDLEDDIEDVQAGLGVEAVGGWALFELGTVPAETEDECVDRRFRTFAAALAGFPPTAAFAAEAQAALAACIRHFEEATADAQLLRCVEAEYHLFRMAERRLCQPEIVRVFKDVDDFIGTAQTILQRRKARAGRSLEHHVAHQLRLAGIPFDAGVDVEGTKPDILIPGKREYLDPDFPVARLFAVGIKTTCKDRWRQVTQEARRVGRKHIITVQKGVSPKQLDEMQSLRVTLVVPEKLHTDYPGDRRGELMSMGAFIEQVRQTLR